MIKSFLTHQGDKMSERNLIAFEDSIDHSNVSVNKERRTRTLSELFVLLFVKETIRESTTSH